MSGRRSRGARSCGGLRDEEAGYTIVEVMVAMVILVFGVLGTLVLMEGSLSSTSRTTAREQGTNLARDLVERSRQAAYADVDLDSAPATLRATLPASDSASALSGSTFEVTRRNVDYMVTVFACSIDDPTDGAGVGDSFCEVPDGTEAPGSPTPGAAVGLTVLGTTVSLAVGGSLLNTVCGVIGVPAVANQLLAATNTVASLSVCPTALGGGTVRYDSHPDDLRRVRIDVSWNRGGAGEVSQTTLLTNPRQS